MNRKHQGPDSPYWYLILLAIVVIATGLFLAHNEADRLISAEKSYNDQRYAKQLQGRQESAIAKSLRRATKEKAQKFLSTEYEAIEGFWPGQGRKR